MVPQDKRATRRQSYQAGWAATFVVIIVLLTLIVTVATGKGSQMIPQEQAAKISATYIPLREQVYHGSIIAPPTIVYVPRPNVTKTLAVSVSTVTTPPPPGQNFMAFVIPPERDNYLRSGPDVRYPVLRELIQGEPVHLLTAPIEIKGQQWQRVKTRDNQIGWCVTPWLSLVARAGE